LNNISFLRVKDGKFTLTGDLREIPHFTSHPVTFVHVEKATCMAKRIIKKSDNTEEVLQAVISGMLEKKAHQVTVLDLRTIDASIADYFVICHGTSTTQAEAIARSVEEVALRDAGEDPLHIEGVGNAQWILLDYFTVVVHVFEEKARAYYDLEELWADAAVLPIEERA